MEREGIEGKGQLRWEITLRERQEGKREEAVRTRKLMKKRKGKNGKGGIGGKKGQLRWERK